MTLLSLKDWKDNIKIQKPSDLDLSGRGNEYMIGNPRPLQRKSRGMDMVSLTGETNL